ncbi:MAG: NAD(P)-dependent oxidoreductase [Candidatus Eremiobacteraeota bacterium]|nr:NAD(P)-dependent oxidoreductase [Candidatus Eremiobacteraeota bacterium]
MNRSASPRKTIVLTGAAGKVATLLRPLLAEIYTVRLTDRERVTNLRENETFARTDLADLEELRAAISGADAIIHLGGISSESTFFRIFPANIDGTQNVFEAAVLEGVERIVFASSGHVNGFYRRNERVGARHRTRPDTLYAVSKICGEEIARVYAEAGQLSVFCIRIGNVLNSPTDETQLSIWISPRDLMQLIELGLRCDLGYEIVYGISRNSMAWWDNKRATELGYAPRDSADEYASRINYDPQLAPGTPISKFLQGGGFASRDFSGSMDRL